MQEVVQGTGNHNVSYEFDLDLIKRVAKNCGSAAVKSAPSYLSTLRYWSGDRFLCITVDGVSFLGGSFTKKHFRLAEIAVEMEQQKKGYGKLLLKLLQSECIKRNIHKITLRTAQAETAYQWYLNQGAQIVGLNKDDYEMEFIL